ncbi:MAG: hypothetical protein ACE5EL_00750, partial [Anaerolineae bacterium]
MLRRGGKLLLLGLIAGCTSRHASARAGDLDPDPAAAVYLPAAFDGVRLPPPWASATPDPGLETRIDGARRLTAPPPGASDQNPAFSPDGSRLVFTRFENGYNDGPAALYALDLEDGAVSRLTPIEDQDNVNLPGAAWHPARDRIVFASDRAEADDLWWIAPDGTDLQRLTNHEGPDAFYEPSWSPDGTWIAFEARHLGDSEDGTLGRIWKVRADGSGATALTSGDHDDRQPNWSPAGNRIVFQRRRATGSVFDLYTMDASGGDLRPVTTANAGDTAESLYTLLESEVV